MGTADVDRCGSVQSLMMTNQRSLVFIVAEAFEMPPLVFRIATNNNRGGWSEEVGLVPEEVGLSNRNKQRRPCQEAVIGGDQSRRRNLLYQEKTGGRDNSDPPCDRQGAVTTVRQGAVTTVRQGAVTTVRQGAVTTVRQGAVTTVILLAIASIVSALSHASIVSALSHASITESRLYRVCVGRRRCADAFPSHSSRRNRSGPAASAPRDGGAAGCLRRHSRRHLRLLPQEADRRVGAVTRRRESTEPLE
jgi:hypothetical protein